MKRQFGRAVLIAAAIVSLTGMEAGAAKPKALVAVKVDSTFFSRSLKRIAILDIITPAVEDPRVAEIEHLVQAALQDQGEFLLLFPEDLRTAAEHAGEKVAYETLLRVWHSRRVIDTPALAKVGPAASIDALVAAEVTHFEQYKLEYTQEGYSTTTVGLKIQMYDARDNTLLWEASEVYVAKSPFYDASSYVSPDAGGVSKQAMRGLPPPPEYDDVSQKVVEDVISTFPHEKAKKEDGRKGGDKKKSKEKD